MSASTVKLLKLRAADAEDIEVVSAVLQDSLAPVCDMAFNAADKNFVMVVQRLRREDQPDGECADRICCALSINGVRAVKTHAIDLRDGDIILELLAIMVNATEPFLSLIFAGEARIRLELEAWSALAEDFGEPWPALCHPCHDKDGENTALGASRLDEKR